MNASETFVYPQRAETLPDWERRTGPFLCRIARTAEDLRAVQRLRYDVFNVELGEGLESAHALQRDEDRHDEVSHHLMVERVASGEVVGTYRLLTRELVERAGGFYSGAEFDLSVLPDKVLADGVELGRACVAKGHRGHRILQLLWAGIAAYVFHYGKRYCFGCASMPEVGAAQVAAAMQALYEGGHMHPTMAVHPQPGYELPDVPPEDEIEVPGLIQAYLALGTKVCGTPARDADFGTIDFFVLLDVQDVNPAVLSRLTA